ncbi:MAG: hypothetical protein GC165_01165 [Armatimonadetes bacterium]|nr:hypothetical protein [Armatimonadota bacterium]
MSAYFHFTVKVISRSTGRSAVACAAYRAGDKLHDRRYGATHDYVPRRGIPENGIVAPQHAPVWARNREELWNRVEEREKRKDSQLAREFEVGFPQQLSAEQRRELLSEFIEQEFTSKGLVADWAIHAPNRKGDERNYHAHVMTTMRVVSEEGFEANKDRSLNSDDQLRHWREAWAERQNDMFARYGIQGEDGKILTVDHRSYEAQGSEQEPTHHLGVHATSMERRGIQTEIGDLNREITERNRSREGQANLPAGTSTNRRLQQLEEEREQWRCQMAQEQERHKTFGLDPQL